MDVSLEIEAKPFKPRCCMKLIEHKAEQVLEFIRKFPSCAVAFSGGVDSAVVASAAYQVLGENAIAVTAQSPSLPKGELQAAQQLAESIGITHQIVQTSEYDDERYRRNDLQRCYFCKSELYSKLQCMLDDLDVSVILNGTNVDDLGDYRPGLTAADENKVRSPLSECQVNKQEVRQIAKLWGLNVWDKPAGPCLSSRIAYGEEVTSQRLRMIDEAESWLRDKGFEIVRVRYHRGDLARIEVPAEKIDAVMALRGQMIETFHRLGFRFVTIDLFGFQSGSMNQLISIEGI